MFELTMLNPTNATPNIGHAGQYHPLMAQASLSPGSPSHLLQQRLRGEAAFPESAGAVVLGIGHAADDPLPPVFEVKTGSCVLAAQKGASYTP